MCEGDQAHYAETTIEVPEDALVVSARLAEARPHGEYVIYENDGRWCYAGGVLADIRFDHDGAQLSGVQEAQLAWSDWPLRQVSELLAMVPVQDWWRAYGWAAFELSYTKDGNREHLNKPEAAAPCGAEKRGAPQCGAAHMRFTDPATFAVLADLLTTPIDSRAQCAMAIDVRRTGRDEVRLPLNGLLLAFGGVSVPLLGNNPRPVMLRVTLLIDFQPLLPALPRGGFCGSYSFFRYFW